MAGKPEEIYIGKKPLLFYTSKASLALMGGRDVVIRARGRRYNAKALDVAEIVCRNNGYEPEIRLSSTERTRNDGRKYRITEVEISIKAG